MLIVRGVNVFPSALRDIVSSFAPEVSGHIVVQPRSAGVKQEPPLPVIVELGRGRGEEPALAEAIRAASATPSWCRPASSSSRGAACSAASTSPHLSGASQEERPMRKLQSQGVHHITLVGADRQTSIDFWEGVLGMPFVFEQPNLDRRQRATCTSIPVTAV